MEFTKESLKEMQSRLGTRQYQIVKEGFGLKDARDLAADEIGKTLVPPVSGEELQRLIGYWLNILYRPDREDKRLKERQEKENTQHNDEDKLISGSEMYRVWCRNNDHVATDLELAYFSGYTVTLFSTIRAELKDIGYRFEKNGYGWNIVRPVQPEPVKKAYTEEDVRLIVDELMKKFGK